MNMSRMFRILRIVSCLFIVSAISVNAGYFDDDDEYDYEATTTASDLRPSVLSEPLPLTDVCVPMPLGGVSWILSVMNSEYGWGDETHRAIIALALNKWQGLSTNNIRQMELQLDVEITKSLLRNRTHPVHPNDLVLYIHALIATQRNPRDFYGQDLVAILLQVVDTSRYSVHPILLLALCNSNAAAERHVHYAKTILQSMLAKKSVDLLALALKAYSCMKTLDFEVDNDLIQEASNTLITHQSSDGSFGNLYTTSLIVQALVSTDAGGWDRESAIVFLKSQSTVNPNMVSTYLIELALHCNSYPFLKQLYPDLPLDPVPIQQDIGHFVQYTVKVSKRADVYFTITVKVPLNATFFDVMKISAWHDSKFNFSYYLDKNQNPSVYSISGVPNDAEGNQYWRLCLQSDIDHDRHQYSIRTVEGSPALLTPKKDDHLIYWFRDTDCGDNS